MTEQKIDKAEIFRVMSKYQKMFGLDDEKGDIEILKHVESGLSYDIMNLFVEPPSNCQQCSKNAKGKGRITAKSIPEGIQFALLCEKCVKASLDSPTKCTIENVNGNAVFKCPHCLLTAPLSNQQFFATHNCVNVTMTRDFAASLSGDAKNDK